MFKDGDPKRLILPDFFDPRINFICIDFPEQVCHIDTFDGNELQEKIESFISAIINLKVQVDLNQGEIVLPKVLETYSLDFGATEESILRFVY